MINPLEAVQIVMSCDPFGSIGTFIVGPRFTAPEDLMLRQAWFSGTGQQVLSSDPDITAPVIGQVSRDFQLWVPEVLDAERNPIPGFTQLTDLAFPLLKGMTLYWGYRDGVGSDQVLQLIFS